MNASFEQNFVGIDVSKGTLDLADALALANSR